MIDRYDNSPASGWQGVATCAFLLALASGYLIVGLRALSRAGKRDLLTGSLVALGALAGIFLLYLNFPVMGN